MPTVDHETNNETPIRGRVDPFRSPHAERMVSGPQPLTHRKEITLLRTDDYLVRTAASTVEEIARLHLRIRALEISCRLEWVTVGEWARGLKKPVGSGARLQMGMYATRQLQALDMAPRYKNRLRIYPRWILDNLAKDLLCD